MAMGGWIYKICQVQFSGTEGFSDWENSIYAYSKKLRQNPAGDAPARFGSILAKTGNEFHLYDSSHNFIGTFDLTNAPAGLAVTAIHQSVDGKIPGYSVLGNDYTLYGNLENGTADPGWLDWSCGLGVSKDNPIILNLDLATAGILFLQNWSFSANGGTTNPIVLGGGGAAAGTLLVTQNIYPIGPLSPITNPYAPEPVFTFAGLWTADDEGSSLCNISGPVTNETIVDANTGEISWELPVDAAGTILKINSLHSEEIIYLSKPQLTYIIPFSGPVTVELWAATSYPLCKSDVSKFLSFNIPSQLVVAGSTGGISLGGSATLQIIGDPSGIYTLVPGQTHDVLYERLPLVTSQTLKIPKPFVKTHFFGK